MGVVWRAFDSELNRLLAIKALLAGHNASPDIERRFLAEAQVTAQLQHPGIPAVHEIGRLPDGRPFLAMKLIAGRTLADLLGTRRDPADDLPRFLAVFEQVCQTVAYAHSRRVLHRDLKPGNIMVGAFGEVQVMDWRLAKVLASSGLSPATEGSQFEDGPVACAIGDDGTDPLSQAGAVMGTLAFMPPEQGRGELDRLDERCDVFGLGAILCVILTGAPPFRGRGRDEVYQQVAHGDLSDAFGRLDRCGADEDLLRLAKDCLAPEPAAPAAFS
jgi:serine/threonine-protein kinase